MLHFGARTSIADSLAHAERIGGPRPLPAGALPDGTMVAAGDRAYALRRGRYLEWSPSGYVGTVPANEMPPRMLLTPGVFLGILAAGYLPVWHESADRLIEG